MRRANFPENLVRKSRPRETFPVADILHQSQPLHYLQDIAFMVASQPDHESPFSSINASAEQYSKGAKHTSICKRNLIPKTQENLDHETEPDPIPTH